MRKRLLSLFLAMAMVVSTLPTSALAEEVESGQETVPTVTETVPEEPAPDPEPATEPETVPVTEPVTESETEAPTEPETEPVTEPETEPATEPATEPEQTELVIDGVHEGYVGDLFQLNARYGDGTVPETVTWESSDKSVVAVEMRENGTYAVLLSPGTAEIIARDAGSLVGRFAVTVLEPATEAPTEEATEAPMEAPTEEATEAPTEVPTESAEATPVQVIFSCSPEDATLCVFPAEEDVDSANGAEQDGSYYLLPGEYTYLATAEGFNPEKETFTVSAEVEDLQITVILNASATEAQPDEGIVDSGTCGENLTWMLTEDGTLTISGTGDMADYHNWSDSSKAPWYPYSSQIVSASIESGVTSIGSYAFDECFYLTNVTIPESVTTIGECAFVLCSSLTSVTIPDSVTTIGGSAFSYSGLTSVSIPKSVTSIGNSAFLSCSSLTSVTIPDSVTTIGGSAFYECRSLTSVTIPGSVTSIDGSTFDECTGLTSVTILEGVTSIGTYAFCACSSLTSVSIPDSVTTIGDSAFLKCSNLTSVTIPESVTSIGERAFCACSSLTSVSIPDSVTTIGYSTFNGCNSLTCVTIPNSVTAIGSYAFYVCSSLTNVTIPEGITVIGDSTFFRCSNLTSVTIPNSVTNIGDNAFYGCNSLTSVSIPDSVTSIGDSAFGACSKLTSVFIPNSVTSIGNNAFRWCSNLADVYFGGTEEQWKKISIADGNDPLLNATIHYNATHICTLIEVPAKAPTSTEDGNYRYWICSICGKAYKDALGRVETTVEAETIRVKPVVTTLTDVTGGEGSFTAAWNVQKDVDGYALQYAANSSFTSCKTVMVYGASTASQTVKDLNAGTYYVRVRTFKTVDGTKTYSLASSALTVTVRPFRPAATALTKVTGDKGSFTATWDAQQNVDGYALQYATNSSFTFCKTVMVYGASTASQTVKDLNAGTYYVRVRTFKTVDGTKTYSLASSALTVTVRPFRPAATALTKVTGDKGSFTATWDAQQNVDGYALQYATNSSFTSCVTVMVYGGSTASATVNSLNARTYYVRIRTFKIVGSSKTYSLASPVLPVAVASTKPDATTLTKVIGGEGRFTATWNAQENVDGYAVQYSTSSRFTFYKTLIVNDASTVSIFVNDLPAGTYYVHVRTFKTVDGSKTYSLPSSTMGVTVSAVKPTATTLAKVTGGEGSFTASWDAQRDVDGYAVQYATNSNFISCKTVMVYGGSVVATTVNSLNAGTYCVRIRTFKIVGSSKIYSLASPTLTVAVASTKPATPMLTKVTGGEGSFTATWNAQQNVDGYAVQYATDSSFTSCKTVMVYGASTTFKTASGLTAGTYYVRVRTFKTVDGSKTYSLASAYLTVTVK